VIELNKSCGADVYCDRDRNECNDDKMIGWRGGLVTWRDSAGVFSSYSGVRVAWLDTLSGHRLTVVVQRK